MSIKPDYHEACYLRGNALLDLNRYKEAIAIYDKAIAFKPDYDEAWFNRGYALDALGQKEAAIDSYDKALEFKPDDHEAWYDKACCYGLQEQIDLAIANPQQAIALHSEYRDMAKTDLDFDRIRDDERFQALIGE